MIKKHSINESRTTLDTLHNQQLQQMNENENELNELIIEKNNLENRLESLEDNIECDQVENRLKNFWEQNKALFNIKKKFKLK